MENKINEIAIYNNSEKELTLSADMFNIKDKQGVESAIIYCKSAPELAERLAVRLIYVLLTDKSFRVKKAVENKDGLMSEKYANDLETVVYYLGETNDIFTSARGKKWNKSTVSYYKLAGQFIDNYGNDIFYDITGRNTYTATLVMLARLFPLEKDETSEKYEKRITANLLKMFPDVHAFDHAVTPVELQKAYNAIFATKTPDGDENGDENGDGDGDGDEKTGKTDFEKVVDKLVKIVKEYGAETLEKAYKHVTEKPIEKGEKENDKK